MEGNQFREETCFWEVILFQEESLWKEFTGIEEYHFGRSSKATKITEIFLKYCIPRRSDSFYRHTVVAINVQIQYSFLCSAVREYAPTSDTE